VVNNKQTCHGGGFQLTYIHVWTSNTGRQSQYSVSGTPASGLPSYSFCQPGRQHHPPHHL